jgi:hypothetical protein
VGITTRRVNFVLDADIRLSDNHLEGRTQALIDSSDDPEARTKDPSCAFPIRVLPHFSTLRRGPSPRLPSTTNGARWSHTRSHNGE